MVIFRQKKKKVLCNFCVFGIVLDAEVTIKYLKVAACQEFTSSLSKCVRDYLVVFNGSQLKLA